MSVENITFTSVRPEHEMALQGKSSDLWFGSFTTAKVQKYASYFFSGLMTVTGTALIGMAIAGIIAWPLAFFAVPLYAGAAALFHSGSHVIDYDDPVELELIRKEALELGLSQVIEKHGWNRVFCYAILSPSQLKSAFINEADSMGLNDLISFYERAESEYERAKAGVTIGTYEIPHPSQWKGKFTIETQSLKWHEIIDRFSFQRLKHYQILPEEEVKFFDESLAAYHQVQSEFELAKVEIERSFLEETKRPRRVYESAIDFAEKDYNLHPDHARLEEIEREYEESLSLHYSRIDSRLSRERAYYEGFERALMQRGEEPLSPENVRALGQAKDKFHREKREAAREKSEIFFTLLQRRDERREACESRLREAKMQKEERTRRAEETFSHDTRPQRIIRDNKIQPHQEKRNQEIDLLDRAYEILRAK